MDTIPSPYLEGCFDTAQYVWAPIETNRGCPFQCTYCYWGAATNARIHKSDEGRVFAELEWLSLNRVMYVVIADANFGIAPRDLAIAEHLAQCKREYGFPLTVAFSSSKNTPGRVSEITRTFESAGLIATQPISLQTMSEAALAGVKRRNIRSSSYTDLQRVLNESHSSSFIELIWPSATPRRCSRTRRGHVSSLYSLRGLRSVAQHFDRTGRMSYAELFSVFSHACAAVTDHPYTRFVHITIDGMYEDASGVLLNAEGAVVHLVLHAARDAFDTLLVDFVERRCGPVTTDVEFCSSWIC